MAVAALRKRLCSAEDVYIGDLIARNRAAARAPLAGIDLSRVRVLSDIEDVRNCSWPHVELFAELAAALPRARFVLNVRDEDAWVRRRV